MPKDITVTVQVYTYDELDLRTQQRIYERWRERQWEDPDLLDQAREEIHAAVSAIGFETQHLAWDTEGYSRGVNYPGIMDLSRFLPIVTQGTRFDPNTTTWPMEELHKHLGDKEQSLLLHPNTSKMLREMYDQGNLEIEVIATNERYNGRQRLDISAEAVGGCVYCGVNLLEDTLPKSLQHKRDAVRKLEATVEETMEWLNDQLLTMADDELEYLTTEAYMREEFANNGTVFTAQGSTHIGLPTTEELENENVQ